MCGVSIFVLCYAACVHRTQVVSPEFLFILLFFCVHLLRLDFLIGTILSQIADDSVTDASMLLALPLVMQFLFITH
jgi:hypothetical protein